MQGVPRIRRIAREQQTSPLYYHRGRDKPFTYCFTTITLEGRGWFRDASGNHSLRPGDVFICQADDPEIEYGYPNDETAPWNFIYMEFEGSGAIQMTRGIVERHGSVFRIPLNNDTLMPVLQWADSPPQIFVSPLYGAQILYSVLGSWERARISARRPDPSMQLVKQAIDIIHSQRGYALDAQELADRLQLSREHLARVFRKHMGSSPYQYILTERMLRACHLLKESRMSVKQISQQCGYNATPHFTRAFKAHVGMPPSRFRTHGAIPVGGRFASGNVKR